MEKKGARPFPRATESIPTELISTTSHLISREFRLGLKRQNSISEEQYLLVDRNNHFFSKNPKKHCQQKINSLEREAEEARTQNRALMTEFSGKLKQKSRALGSTLDRTRPYFEARKKSARTRSHAEKLSNDYHQTILMLKNARDVVKQRVSLELNPQS